MGSGEKLARTIVVIRARIQAMRHMFATPLQSSGVGRASAVKIDSEISFDACRLGAFPFDHVVSAIQFKREQP
jgi:hypothetical protein